MASISEYHKYLFFGKITGSLSPGEAEELDILFIENPGAQEAFQQLANTLPEKYVQNHYSHLNSDGFWKDIGSAYKFKKRQKKRRLIAGRLSVAAAVAATLIACWAILYDPVKEEQKPATATGKAVIITLPDGQTYNLSEQQGKIADDNIELYNNKHSLSYKYTGNSRRGINQIEVPAGMDYHVVLSDGSEIWMNASTRLQFPSAFESGMREISLSGEAYIKVVKNPAQKFIVRLPESTVEVTGTEFNVNSYRHGQDKVALVKGSVTFTGGNSAVAVKPGIQAVYYQSNDRIDQHTFDPKSVLSWREGFFYFEEADLDEISEVLLRWYGIKSYIDNPKLKERKFAGVLNKNKPVADFLKHLGIISGIESYFDAEGVLHFK
jgi:ferric-dicitrate binding protein FerR (iron transport regulator)